MFTTSVLVKWCTLQSWQWGIQRRSLLLWICWDSSSGGRLPANMVHVKSVLIQGFKSYKDQTALPEFDPGHNVIGSLYEVDFQCPYSCPFYTLSNDWYWRILTLPIQSDNAHLNLQWARMVQENPIFFQVRPRNQRPGVMISRIEVSNLITPCSSIWSKSKLLFPL